MHQIQPNFENQIHSDKFLASLFTSQVAQLYHSSYYSLFRPKVPESMLSPVNPVKGSQIRDFCIFQLRCHGLKMSAFRSWQWLCCRRWPFCASDMGCPLSSSSLVSFVPVTKRPSGAPGRHRGRRRVRERELTQLKSRERLRKRRIPRALGGPGSLEKTSRIGEKPKEKKSPKDQNRKRNRQPDRKAVQHIWRRMPHRPNGVRSSTNSPRRNLRSFAGSS